MAALNSRVWAGWFCLLALLGSLLGAEKTRRRVPFVQGHIRVNGVLSEEIWQQALRLELLYEINPGENIAPPVRTEVWLAHSRTHLYLAARAHDPRPPAIRAHYSDRDTVFEDDWLGITLDTFNDQRHMYTFIANPLGVQADLVEIHSQVNTNWDAIWESAGVIDDGGYVVEMAIPFSSFRFQPRQGDQTWGLDVVRQYPRRVVHLISLVPRDRNNYCTGCQMDKVTGFAGVKPGKHIEIDPTVSALKTRESETELSPGLTAHWGLAPNLTLSGAVNPDFSQVEADAAQLDINTRFALYYPEKRPFFLEGTSIFNTRLPAVYTRALAEPDWGLKLTGKTGPFTIGLYGVQDHITNLIFPGSYGSMSTTLADTTLAGVLRGRLDVGETSNIGVLVTHRQGGDYFNRLAGLDAYLRLNQKKYIQAQFLTSRTQYPGSVAADFDQPQDSFNGTALDLLFRHESRDFGYTVSYRQVSPLFRADLGFLPQAGYRHVMAAMIFAWWGSPDHWYTFMNAVPTVEYEVDADNNLIYKSLNLTYTYKGPLQSSISLGGSLGRRAFGSGLFNTDCLQASISLKPSGSLILGLAASYGSHIDFVNCRQGRRTVLNPAFTFKPGRHLYLGLDHIFERLDVDPGRLYTAHVTNLRLVYQFNRRLFLRTLLQYTDYRCNVDNYLDPPDPRSRRLFSQFLFSYKVNPRTMLFLGYSDDHTASHQQPLHQKNRTLFLKIGYALLL